MIKFLTKDRSSLISHTSRRPVLAVAYPDRGERERRASSAGSPVVVERRRTLEMRSESRRCPSVDEGRGGIPVIISNLQCFKAIYRAWNLRDDIFAIPVADSRGYYKPRGRLPEIVARKLKLCYREFQVGRRMAVASYPFGWECCKPSEHSSETNVRFVSSTGLIRVRRPRKRSTMLLLNSVEPERWYKVSEVAKILGWSEDVIYELIHEGFLQAQVKPGSSWRRKREYNSLRLQGCEIIRYAKESMTELKPGRSRRRVA